jgi:hypothetical protein
VPDNRPPAHREAQHARCRARRRTQRGAALPQPPPAQALCARGHGRSLTAEDGDVELSPNPSVAIQALASFAHSLDTCNTHERTASSPPCVLQNTPLRRCAPLGGRAAGQHCRGSTQQQRSKARRGAHACACGGKIARTSSSDLSAAFSLSAPFSVSPTSSAASLRQSAAGATFIAATRGPSARPHPHGAPPGPLRARSRAACHVVTRHPPSQRQCTPARRRNGHTDANTGWCFNRCSHKFGLTKFCPQPRAGGLGAGEGRL